MSQEDAGATASDLRTSLRARGYRLTPQRRLVLDAVAALGHATPDDVAARLEQDVGGISPSTIYRTLELLEELGLVTHTHLGHRAPTYHPADAAGHVHLVCRDCGRVEEVLPQVMDDVVQRLAAERGFRVDVEHVAVFGRCAACSAEVDAATAGVPG